MLDKIQMLFAFLFSVQLTVLLLFCLLKIRFKFLIFKTFLLHLTLFCLVISIVVLGIWQASAPPKVLTKQDMVKLVVKYSAQYKVPFSIANGLFQEESAYNPQAVSNKAAMGLGQILPSTFVAFCDKGDNPFNPEHNIKVSLKYLRHIYDNEGKQDWVVSIQKYNGGNKYWMSEESKRYAIKVFKHAEYK